MADLQRELQAYRDDLPVMLRMHEGDYVVIKGSNAVHFSTTYQEALTWAYQKFGLEDFFVKKVAEDQNIAHFSRDLGPCRS